MANGLTSATLEDGHIQQIRHDRAVALDAADGAYPNRGFRRQSVGWSIGRGYEADYLEGKAVSELMRYQRWLRFFLPQQNISAGLLTRQK